MKTLKESILTGGAETSFDNVEIFEKAKKWLDRNAVSVKGLKINKDGTLDAEHIRFWSRLDLYTLPSYIKFNYVNHYSIISCLHWHGLNGYPKKMETLYIEDIYAMTDLSNLEGTDIDMITINGCNRLKPDLCIPKNCNIKTLRIIRCGGFAKEDRWKMQCLRHHINFIDH